MSMATIIPAAVVPSGAHLQVPGAAAAAAACSSSSSSSSSPMATIAPPTAGIAITSTTTAAAGTTTNSGGGGGGGGNCPPVRPGFNSRLTSDRLREGAGLYLPPQFRPGSASTNLRKGRVSVFRETGLFDGQDDDDDHRAGSSSP
ncbi:hypothetical protein JDV02_001571 [Purpureocillium takamizusanense]|uniref:Uncharacterized protein n=1 Tax=Purpureocillium takamizusanense TaxID=2060973 RepID=A0A9Q8Q973_9HYPO|nr:uncharacterized protein JDV02_001571 [Purpureocillium takamizusanense]UNI14996.1 hypothetical protein JDV02_001571 [Purpureocillium takamizusanense]